VAEITKALKDKGVKAKFILSSDDMDPLDKPSKELSEEDNKKYESSTVSIKIKQLLFTSSLKNPKRLRKRKLKLPWQELLN